MKALLLLLVASLSAQSIPQLNPFIFPYSIAQSNPPQAAFSKGQLSIEGNILGNADRFIFQLKTGSTFNTFVEMGQIKANFIPYSPSSLFCSQKSDNHNKFECIAMFPSGIPQNTFYVTFSYIYNSISASLTLIIYPYYTIQVGGRRSSTRLLSQERTTI